MNIESKQPVFSSELTDLLKFNDFLNKFRKMRRLIYYKGNRARERNGDHCFHIAMIAWHANERLGLGLNVDKLVRYALVHDLLEVYAGDPPNVPKHLEGKHGPLRKGKEEREAKALKKIKKEWGGEFPSLLLWLTAYEAQGDAESCFVMAIDKLAAEMNIYQDNGRTDKKFDMTMDDKERIKRHRLFGQPEILKLYDELYAVWRKDPARQYQP